MKKSKIAQRSGLALALEPRMMFDGAAVVTAAAVANDASHAPEASGAAATDSDATHADATTNHEFSSLQSDNVFKDADGDARAWSDEKLPDGLHSDTGTHPIAGTSQTAGNNNVTETATDPHGENAGVDPTEDMAKNATPEAVAALVVADATTGHEYSCTLPDSLFSDPNGDALVWSVENLPDGLHFDADTHTLTGTPSLAGDYTIKVTATDETGAKTSVEVALDVVDNHAPEAVSSELPMADGTEGDSYTYTLPDTLFTDADGDTLVWSVSDLPDGLHFDMETHTISGTPTSAGDYSLTVTATDAAGTQAHMGLTLTVAERAFHTTSDNRGFTLMDASENTAPACSWSISELDAGTQGAYYEFVIPEDLFTDADGDTLTWSVTNLPDGLNFNPATRTIYGTPTDFIPETNDMFGVVDYVMVKVSVDDGRGGTAETDLFLRIAEASPIDPSVSATVNDGTCTIDASGSVVSGGSLDLFDNVNVSLDGGGNPLTSLVITVGTSGAEHSLVIDGTTIPLTATTFMQETTGGGQFTYRVNTMNGKTTITISLNESYTTGEVAALIDGITYKTADPTAVHIGSFDVSLDLYDETGSTEQSDIHATVSIDSDVNFAPEFEGDNPLDLGGMAHGTDITEATEVAYSADGHYAYVADASGHMSVFFIDDNGKMTEIQHISGITDLGSVTDMAIDHQTGAIYAVSDRNIVILKIDGTSHELSYSETVSIGGTGTDIAVSNDGAHVYVGCRWNGVSVFDVNTTTGELTHRFNLTENIGNSPCVTTAGQYVCIVGAYSPAIVQVFAWNAENGLDLVGDIDSGISSWDITFRLGASEDGNSIYLYSRYTDYSDWTEVSKIQAYAFDGSTLSALGTTDVGNVTDIQVSADGGEVYVTTSDSTLQTYSVDGGALILKNTVGELNNANAVSVRADGDILVAGEKIYRLSGQQGGLYGETIGFTNGINISDANLDVLNNGDGDYGGASITIHRQGGANAADVFAFAEDNGYTVSGNDIMKDGTIVASFTNSSGKLVISFKAGATTAQANAILHQWGYSHDPNSTEPEVTIQIVANDGVLNSQTRDISIRLMTNTPPSLEATVKGSSDYDTAGETVLLFANASANVGEIGQYLTRMEIEVGGLGNVSAAEYLIVDGTTIVLNQDSTGTTANGYTYTYSLNGNTATLTITSADGMTVASAGDLVDGLTYGNTSETAMTGTRTFTITSLQDDGGSLNGGSDTAAPGIVSEVILAVNNAPTVDIEADATDPTLYYNDGSLEGFSGYVNEVDVSDNGDAVIICASSQANGNGDFTMYIYARDTNTGALTLLQSFTQGTTDDPATTASEVDGLHNIGSAAISHDGERVYVVGYDGDATTCTIVLFNRNAQTGELTYEGIQDTQAISNPYSKLAPELVLSKDGKSLYTINGKAFHYGGTNNHDLVTYSIETDGTLTKLDTYTGGSSDLGVDSPTSLTISPDGDYVYVANGDSKCIGVFARNESGALTFVKAITANNIEFADGAGEMHHNALANVMDIVITSDGKYMYASTNNSGVVSVFSLGDDGLPIYVESFDVGTIYLRELALSSDNSTLYVGAMGSGNLYICAIDAATGELSSAGTLAMGGAGQTAHFAIGGDGENIYIGGYLGGSGLQIAVPLPVVELDHDGYNNVNIGSGIHLGDVDLDVADNYDDMTVTVSRTGGANAADAFGFENGNGLTLSGNDIVDGGGNTVATFTNQGGTLTIAFTSSASKALANQVVQQITYKGTTSDPRTPLTVEVSDGHKSAQRAITLVYHNEIPTVNPDVSPPIGRTGITYSEDLSGLFADGDGDTLTWNVDDSGLAGSGLSYNAATHTLAGTPTTAGEYTLTLSVDDGHGGTAERTLTITVLGNTAPVADSGFTPSEGTTGHEYSCDLSELYSDTEGDAITVSIDGTTPLPDGLSLEQFSLPGGATGYRIVGTPDSTAAGDHTVTIVAEDSWGATNRITLTLKVTENAAPVADPNFTVPQGTTGHTYSCDLSELFGDTDADGDDVSWVVNDSGLAGSGLTYDAVNDSITGTPTATGEYTITVTAEDGHGGTATETLTLIVEANADPVADPNFELPPAAHDQSYEVALPADLFTDGNGDAITVTVDPANPLPDGLSLEQVSLPGGVTGYRIVGVPTTPNTYTVGLIADDGHGGTTTLTLTLEVGTPPSVTADATGGSITISQGGALSDNDIDLFDNVTVGLDVNNEALTDLVFTVDVYGADHALVIDGQEIVLTATGTSMHTEANGYGYSVEIIDGKAVVTIDLTSTAAHSAADVQALIDDMAYRVVAPGMESTSVTVTLDSLSDASAHPAEVHISSSIVIARADSVDGVSSPGDGGHGEAPGAGPDGDHANNPFPTNDPFSSPTAGNTGPAAPGTTGPGMAGPATWDAGHAMASFNAMISRDSSHLHTDADPFASAPEQDGAYRTLGEVYGTWAYDAAGNRHVFDLPSPGRLGMDAPIASYQLIWAETGKAVNGLRVDVKDWCLVSAGFKNPGHARVLLLIETENGDKIELPVELDSRNAGRGTATPEPSAEHLETPSGAPAVRETSSLTERLLASGEVLPGALREPLPAGKPEMAAQLRQSLELSMDKVVAPTALADASDVPSGEYAALLEMAAAN